MTEENKRHSSLREAMSKLDYALPDYVFDSDEGEDIQECIGNVWEEIDKIEKQMGEKL
jgi:hypothetical protein